MCTTTMESNETSLHNRSNSEENNQNDALNWNYNELDPDTIEKLKGDTIGNTVYSESFVLKTLLEIADLKWNEKLEEDLCFLWDMTIEEEVCEFLMKVSFPSIAADCIGKYDDQRFVEIIIGILGNIVSKLKIEDKKVVHSVLLWLQTDDHLILIQVMRFIKGVDHFENDKKLQFITKEIMEKFGFILCSSTNRDLLVITLDVLSKITTNFKINVDVLCKEIINNCCVGYHEIYKQENSDDFELIHNHSNDQQFTLHFTQFILNICLYVNEFNNKELLEGLRENKNEFSNVFGNILTLNLNLLDFHDITQMDDITEFYIEAFAIIFPLLNINYTKEIFSLLINTISTLIKKSIIFTQSFLDLFIHFVINSEINILIKDNRNNLTILCCIIEYCEKNNNECIKNVNKIIELKKLLKP